MPRQPKLMTIAALLLIGVALDATPGVGAQRTVVIESWTNFR